MKKILIAVSATVAFAATVFAGNLFTDLTSHYPPDIVRQANAALNALEDSIDGTTPMTSPVVQGTLTAISTNGATTNVVITVDGVVDGATIGATTLTVAQGGTGAATLTGVLKGNGTGAISAATAGTDYAAATTGSSLLKADGSGGFANATAADVVTLTMVNHPDGTNNATITLTYGTVNYITPHGGEDNATNTITLSDATLADIGKIAYVVIDHDVSLTNSVSLAYGVPWYGPSLVMNPGDAVMVWAQETNVLRAVGGILSGSASKPE